MEWPLSGKIEHVKTPYIQKCWLYNLFDFFKQKFHVILSSIEKTLIHKISNPFYREFFYNKIWSNGKYIVVLEMHSNYRHQLSL